MNTLVRLSRIAGWMAIERELDIEDPKVGSIIVGDELTESELAVLCLPTDHGGTAFFGIVHVERRLHATGHNVKVSALYKAEMPVQLTKCDWLRGPTPTPTEDSTDSRLDIFFRDFGR